jgi:hypothetical protein
LGLAPIAALASELAPIPPSRLARLAWAVVVLAAARAGISVAACAIGPLVACVWSAAASGRPASSAVELGVSLLLDAGDADARFWKGAGLAVPVRVE